MGKKNEFTFNIGFNPNNAGHMEVAGLLNELGRGKAAYLVKAVQFYREYDQRESGSSFLLKGIGHAELENMVRRIIMEQKWDGGEKLFQESKNSQKQIETEENDKYNKTGLKTAEVNSIMEALHSFRGNG